MVRLSDHGRELAGMEYADFRIAIMSHGPVLRNQGAGWKSWKRLKAGADSVAYAAKALAAYHARPADFHAYIRALVAACDLAHRGQLNALVDQMPNDPDAVWSMVRQSRIRPAGPGRGALLPSTDGAGRRQPNWSS